MPRRGFALRRPEPKRELVSTHKLVTRVAPEFDASEELQAEWMRVHPAAVLLESALQSLLDRQSLEVVHTPAPRPSSARPLAPRLPSNGLDTG